jgi:hypothetical protein
MNAQIKPVPRALERPKYDNHFLGHEADWISANVIDLLLWWEACGQQDGEMNPKDFPAFARSQHDIQQSLRDAYRDTHSKWRDD